MKLMSKVVKIDPKIIVSLPSISIPETHCIIMLRYGNFVNFSSKIRYSVYNKEVTKKKIITFQNDQEKQSKEEIN